MTMWIDQVYERTETLKTKQSKGRLYILLEHFVFLSTWLVCWTWPKLYTTTCQEWENRKYKLFDR